jgi:hypothetical protein
MSLLGSNLSSGHQVQSQQFLEISTQFKYSILHSCCQQVLYIALFVGVIVKVFQTFFSDEVVSQDEIYLLHHCVVIVFVYVFGFDTS